MNTQTNLIFILILSIAVVSFSCRKSSEEPVSGNIYFYLLDSYDTKSNSCEILKNTVQLANLPLIEYDDIISYNTLSHSFSISEQAKNVIQELEHSVSGLAFALTNDSKIIYTGYFWPAFSSLCCDWITIDPLRLEYDGQLRVDFGYPTADFWNNGDPRNDSVLLNILRRDNKLIE